MKYFVTLHMKHNEIFVLLRKKHISFFINLIIITIMTIIKILTSCFFLLDSFNSSYLDSFNSQVLVLDGKDMGDGKNVEAFVTIQIGDLRKETRVSYFYFLFSYFFIYCWVKHIGAEILFGMCC